MLVLQIKYWEQRNWVTLRKITQGQIISSGNGYMGRKEVRSGREAFLKWGRESKWVQCFCIVKWLARSFENVLFFWKSTSTNQLQIVQIFRKYVCLCGCVPMYMCAYICLSVCIFPPEDWKWWILLPKRPLKLFYIENKGTIRKQKIKLTTEYCLDYLSQWPQISLLIF